MKTKMRRKKNKIIFLCLFLFVTVSCSLFEKSSQEVKNYFLMDDIEPPVLLEVQSVSNNQVRLVFNEAVVPAADSFAPNIVFSEGYSVLVTLTESVKAGKQILLEGRVKDKSGNSNLIQTPVWGFNADLPVLVINEFSTRGEGNNPDRTELMVLSDGNLGGSVLYNGIPSSWDNCVVFDAIEVKKGDFIVVWWTESLPEGLKNTDGIINICACSSYNLPGYNGVITLAKSPAQGSDVIDCVIYSNNSATYDGYGSKQTKERAEKAIESGWWKTDAVDSTYNTATRTFCRSSDGLWYVCTTKGSTFGFQNNPEPYIEN